MILNYIKIYSNLEKWEPGHIQYITKKLIFYNIDILSTELIQISIKNDCYLSYIFTQYCADIEHIKKISYVILQLSCYLYVFLLSHQIKSL